MTEQELKARIAELEAKNERLKGQIESRNSQPLRYKVGEKGGVVLSGTGRYPITQYYGQWIRILDFLDVPATNVFREFLEEQKAEGNLALKAHEQD